MKTSTTKKVMYIIWAALVAVTLSSYGIVNSASDTAMQGSSVPRFENLTGNIEFYIRPSGDNRLWHVINSYHGLGTDDGLNYNRASYFFGTDSVSVINEYAVMPGQDELDISLVNTLQNENISNNQ